MCPYYNEQYKICLLYKTTQSDYNRNAYCMECKKDYTDCPNYKECARSNGGIVPPPYKYK